MGIEYPTIAVLARDREANIIPDALNNASSFGRLIRVERIRDISQVRRGHQIALIDPSEIGSEKRERVMRAVATHVNMPVIYLVRRDWEHGKEYANHILNKLQSISDDRSERTGVILEGLQAFAGRELDRIHSQGEYSSQHDWCRVGRGLESRLTGAIRRARERGWLRAEPVMGVRGGYGAAKMIWSLMTKYGFREVHWASPSLSQGKEVDFAGTKVPERFRATMIEAGFWGYPKGLTLHDSTESMLEAQPDSIFYAASRNRRSRPPIDPNDETAWTKMCYIDSAPVFDRDISTAMRMGLKPLKVVFSNSPEALMRLAQEKGYDTAKLIGFSSITERTNFQLAMQDEKTIRRWRHLGSNTSPLFFDAMAEGSSGYLCGVDSARDMRDYIISVKARIVEAYDFMRSQGLDGIRYQDTPVIAAEYLKRLFSDQTVDFSYRQIHEGGLDWFSFGEAPRFEWSEDGVSVLPPEYTEIYRGVVRDNRDVLLDDQRKQISLVRDNLPFGEATE